MKIAEVRMIIDSYSADQLKTVITELYKAIPKAVKEEEHIDEILKEPDSVNTRKTQARQEKTPDIDDLENEADLFIENATCQYYLIPNKIVPKHERPKWRFVAKRLYKAILLAAGPEENRAQSARLLEKLYILLCDSCEYTLFNAYDSFQSVGIEQTEFFHKVLFLRSQCSESSSFIRGAILLIINHALNRYTLYDDLIMVFMEFLKTPDLREMTITTCDEIRESIKKEPQSKKQSMHQKDYKKEEKLNNLALTGFYCHAHLFEYEKAVDYFKKYYEAGDAEVLLYILLKHLYYLDQKKLIVEEYNKAINRGIKPRDTLVKVYDFIKTRGELPARFGW
jgi:hypothetical protein